MNRIRFLSILLIASLLVIPIPGGTQAQESSLPSPGEIFPDPIPADEEVQAISIQGRLTDASGVPLDGIYTIQFNVYDQPTEGYLQCSDTRSVAVTKGLFSERIENCANDFQMTGVQLYLGIQVGEDPEMTPRQVIDPVPAAWKLRPRSRISGSIDYPLLFIHNTSILGTGLYVQSDEDIAIMAVSRSQFRPAIEAGNFDGPAIHALSGGTALIAESGQGLSIFASGTGRIKSKANSYLFISGNTLQKSNSADTTQFVYDSVGGYQVFGGSDWANPKTVVLPVTVLGQLFGQDFTASQLDLYYQTSDSSSFIGITAMRKQAGAGRGYEIFKDETDYNCPGTDPCTLSWTLSANNRLSADQGILYIALQFNFSSPTAYILIGGARLQLIQE